MLVQCCVRDASDERKGEWGSRQRRGSGLATISAQLESSRADSVDFERNVYQSELRFDWTRLDDGEETPRPQQHMWLMHWAKTCDVSGWSMEECVKKPDQVLNNPRRGRRIPSHCSTMTNANPTPRWSLEYSTDRQNNDLIRSDTILAARWDHCSVVPNYGFQLDP